MAMAEFKGITQNECNFQGTVEAEPVFFQVDGGEGALFRVKTYVPMQGAGGQWTDSLKVVPIYCMNPTKVANTIKKYVVPGKRVLVRAYHDNWMDGNEEKFGLIMTRIALGGGPPKEKPFAPDLPSE
jgi:hypothetical protein